MTGHRLLAALAALPVALMLAAPASADDTAPPYVDHTRWAQWGVGKSSLQVYPTHAGRVEAARFGTDSQGAEAWGEVLALSPDADTPGMRAQFLCHWHYAEFAEPGKASWNLEPWRPVVDDKEMIASGCNPGGPEESF
jgi:hypothetical protein